MTTFLGLKFKLLIHFSIKHSRIRYVLVIIVFLFSIISTFSQVVTLSGYVKESGSKENISNVNLAVVEFNKSAQSNSYGYFSISFPKKDSVSIRISMIGYKTIERRVSGKNNTNIEFQLEIQNSELDELKVNAEENEKKSLSTKISTINIPIALLKNVPSLLGEKDIVKAIQLLPGVQSGSEGSNGLFVRGGGADQNLILMDEAKVYNVSHLFGFFSIFNGDALKSLEFIKGGFPARYGGRISSVIDVQMKDGNKNETHGELGIGLITSRLTIESPIKKDKSSFILSARRSYPDLIFGLVKNQDGSVLKSNFYDVNGKLNFDFNTKNRIFFSTYNGKDNFFQRVNRTGDNFRNLGFNWGNSTGTFRWNHIFTQKLFSNLSFIYSDFKYSLQDIFGNSSRIFSSKLNEIGIKYDFDFFPNSKHSYKFGVNVSSLNFVPSLSISKENGARVNKKEIEQIKAIDAAVYFEDTYKPTEKLFINYGLRTAFFLPKGSRYYFIEPRIAINYSFMKNWSVKAAYSIMNQPIQLLTNNGLGLSIDVWVPSTAKIPPQNSKQIVLGLVHEFSKKMSFEFEMYSKQMQNILSLKEGASILSTVSLFRDRNFSESKLNWNDISTSGNGNSKGIELFFKKNQGKLNGWLSYTLAKTLYQFEAINNGNQFFPIHDRRHQLSIVSSYQKSKRIKFNGTFVLSSGNPVTLPQISYESFEIDHFTGDLQHDFNNIIDYGSQRNNYRTPVYNRLDVSVQFLKQKKIGLRTWEFGFYNTLLSKNVFAYEAGINGRNSKNNTFLRTKTINEISILLFIPSVSYYIKF